jgi:hypothetical protein
MTPQEKALELVDYFEKAMMDADMYGDYSEATKKCALICCNEVLGYMGADRGYTFCSEVKQEIEKL